MPPFELTTFTLNLWQFAYWLGTILKKILKII